MTASTPSNAHACNCIGCCRVCGGCRTNPLHAATCAKIADLNVERIRIFDEARQA